MRNLAYLLKRVEKQFLQEPFTTAKDSLEVQVYLMVWEKGRINRKNGDQEAFFTVLKK